MPKISLFKNSYAEDPIGAYELPDLLNKIKKGFWKKVIENLRSKQDLPSYKKLKASLPAMTISGEFSTRNKNILLEKRLKSATGLIALDVDKKDNPKMRTKDVVDSECLVQFVSCSGEGIKIIYRCTPTTDSAVHHRIYDAAVLRLQNKGIKIKVDPIVKSIASLQYISYDPDLYYNEKSKVVIKPLASIRISSRPPSKDLKSDLDQLNAYIDSIGSRDVTKDYEDWLLIMFGLSYSLGEAGRKPMHRICRNYPAYSSTECDEKYDGCLTEDHSKVDKPVTLATVFSILINAIPKVKLRHLAKKYNKGHAVGVGEDVEQGDLSGLVRYKLFLFKKIFDKETNTLVELLPHELNLNAFEKLLRHKGFFRYEDNFVSIVSNVVEIVDIADILRVITDYIETEGDYTFTYRKLEYAFSWEEIVHLWRKIRALGTTFNQIASSLTHWIPNLLKDSAAESYIPYQNGILKVTKTEIKLIQYGSHNQQIWKERILPRNFTFTDKKGMFGEFFANVCGRGKDFKSRTSSEHFKRALWYYGYMLQGSKRQSTARAWLLYDTRSGNNGRSGKTIIGQAVGKIRSMVVLDGKKIDFNNRFAFQTVLPWTDIIFIDDPSKYMSLNPLFNMITGETYAEKKGVTAFLRPIKFMIASNWVLEAEETSEIGRQFVTQLDDFYIRYAKEHKNTIQPIVDLHGKEFFTDWNEKDWSEFDNFSARALQIHLRDEAPNNIILGNSKLVRFIQVNEEELFFELAINFVDNVKKSEDGKSLTIAQQLLVGLIKESGVNANKAGRIAREFLKSIGAPEIEMTTLKIAGQVRMAYKLNTTWDKLDFGETGKRLPKPKF